MMKKKKEKFRLNPGPEKVARLDVRITEQLRLELERFCREKNVLLTNAVTRALENYLKSEK